MRPWHKPISCMVLLGALVATLLRTVRGPNDWAEAHWLLDYRFGFVKRGLPGQLLRWAADAFGFEVDAAAIATVAFGVLFVLLLLLLGMAFQVARQAQWHPAAIAVLAATLSSPFVVMTAHLVGYFDHVFLSLGIASVWLATRGRIWAGALLQTAALFVHEGCIVLTFPVFALAAVLQAARPGADAGRRAALAPLCLPLLAAGVLSLFLGAPPAGFLVHYGAWLGQHGFIEKGFDTLTPQMLSMSLGDYAAIVLPKWGERMAQPSSFGLVLPTVMVLLAWLIPRLPHAFLCVETVAVGGVVLLPQVMHLVAFDLERLWVFSIFTTFAVVWLYSARGERAAATSDGVLVLALLALAANFVMETPLLDFEFDRMARPVRMGVLIAIIAGLAAVAAKSSAVPWRERLRLRRR